MAEIHPTAVISPKAEIADDVTIGAFCVVGPNVELGSGVVIDSHVVVEGTTTIAAGVRIFPFAAVGKQPQDLKYAGEASRLDVGANTVIREHATLHTGTEGGGMVTRIGANCLLMVGAHIAHDCQLGDHVIIVNNVLLGGHVVVDDFAIVGGQSAILQRVRIGRHAMIGGGSAVDEDVIPYATAMGNRARLQSLNLIGLKRRDFSREEIHALRAAYRELFADDGQFLDRVESVAEKYQGRQLVHDVIDFIKADTSRAICQPE
jgi:UDP-N-acetylglucosamine acyltransferase